VRAAITEHRGHVFKTIGDAFCATFARPGDAVFAMLAAQRALLAEDFSSVNGLRVRAAIHSGTADERDADYFGPAVNKVARLLAIGHGGQILATNETAALVDGSLPAEVSLLDLGAYHLKDIAEPQRVHQLLARGLPSEFPPLRSLGTLPSDLSILDAARFHPVPSFSGRDAELAAVHAALQHDGAIVVVHGSVESANQRLRANMAGATATRIRSCGGSMRRLKTASSTDCCGWARCSRKASISSPIAAWRRSA